MTKRLILLATVLMLVVVGCGAKKATTPQQAVLNMSKALANGDAKAFAACFDTDENGKKLLLAMGEAVDAMLDFQKKVEKTLKEEDADKLMDRLGGDVLALTQLTEDMLKVTEDGEKATCRVEEVDVDAMDLVKKDGVWLILPPDEIPTGEDLEEELMQMGVMKDVFVKMGKELKDDMTVDALMEAFTEMREKLMGEAKAEAAE